MNINEKYIMTQQKQNSIITCHECGAQNEASAILSRVRWRNSKSLVCGLKRQGNCRGSLKISVTGQGVLVSILDNGEAHRLNTESSTSGATLM